MYSNSLYKYRTMFIATILVLVSAVSANVNSTNEMSGRSRMAWMKALLDHHGWDQLINNNSLSLPAQCEKHLRVYLAALRDGQLWASKIFDASGQYSPNVLFGNEYWLGSLNACHDLQLAQYHVQTPPFPTTFYVAKINLTIDNDHLPQSRLILVGECMPASCGAEALRAVLGAAEADAAARAAAAGLAAAFRTVGVRPVPGTYDLFADPKLQILGSAAIAVGALMVAASLYEGYLERRQRLAAATRDLELAHGDNPKQPTNSSNPQRDGNPASHNGDKDLRRETCGVWSELLLSFSILSNGRTILSTDKPSDGALTCLHGMRFMSVIWVIMVHTYLTIFYVADNKAMRVVTERNFWYQSVGNASYCVDTFFVISGILVTILFLRTEEKKSTKKLEQPDKQDINKNINGFTNSALSISVISQQSFKDDLLEQPTSKSYTKREIFGMIKSFFIMLSYRIVRLTPAYAFVIGLNEIALRYTHDHSVFEPAIFDHITCDRWWWRNLLYINNLFPQKEMCMVWSWYMANDMQFYVVGLILLLISVKHPKFAMLSVGVLMVSSWATTIYISVRLQYKARIQEPFEMFDPLYDKPWSRIGPYLVGMMVGWYLHKSKCRARVPRWAAALGWAGALALLASLIFSMLDGYFEVWPTAFYISIGHTAWGAAVAWVAVCCSCGYGGLVHAALSYRALLPLSRLTYCAYLVHPTIMMYTSFLLDGPFHMHNSTVLAIYMGYAVMAFLASFVISLAFEAPAVRLLKIVSGGTRRQNKH